MSYVGGMSVADRRWWETRWFFALLLIVAAMPVLWPQIPPLVDLPGHMGRYRVELDIVSSNALQRYFEFRWAVIGNLGIDLLIIPLASAFGVELALKLIVISIPVLTTAGIIWTAREVHGRFVPTALFAIPFVFSYPFNFGFINFSLSMALALLAFALWLRLDDYSHSVRSVIFVPLSFLLWLVHVFGWGVLGLLVWSAELVKIRDRNSHWTKALVTAARKCLPLCAPIVPMLLWRSGDAGGPTAGFLNIGSKILALFSAVRDRWLFWDSIAVGVAVVLLASALFDKHLSFSRRLAIPSAVLALIFVLLPSEVFGSAYADMRLIPFVLMLAVVAIRPRDTTNHATIQRLAVLGTVFVGLRLTGNAVSYWIADNETTSELTAIKYIAPGSSVLSLVGDSCGKIWAMPRHSHLGSMVIVRKQGFSNDQWQIPGAQLLRVTYMKARPFDADPSEITISGDCKKRILANAAKLAGVSAAAVYVQRKYRTTDEALEEFPRDAFDYVWLIRPEGYTAPPPADLRPIWSGRSSWLFQVIHTRDSATRHTSNAPAIPTTPSDT